MNTNVDDMPGLSKILKELEVYWTIDLYLDNTNIKSWQKGSNISRPTDKLLTQVISLAKNNPYLANSSHYLNATKKKKIKIVTDPKPALQVLDIVLFHLMLNFIHVFLHNLIMNLKEWI